MHTIQETLEFILKSITQNSDSINIDSRIENDVTILEVNVPTEIIGQIIGKEGKIIKSIRLILALSYPTQKFSLDIKG
jgi:predicted RNA-binding protein YlqC (UPF0109 family)